MSSYWAGYCGSGLILKPDEFDAFIEKYKTVNNDEITQDIISYGVDGGDIDIREIGFLSGKHINNIPKDSRTVDNSMGMDPIMKERKHFHICHIDSDNCEGAFFIPFVVNGRLNLQENRTEGDHDDKSVVLGNDFYIVWSDKDLDGPSYFKTERAYGSYNEFRQEFKDKLEAYLPEDFDWDAHIGTCSYACYA